MHTRRRPTPPQATKVGQAVPICKLRIASATGTVRLAGRGWPSAVFGWEGRASIQPVAPTMLGGFMETTMPALCENRENRHTQGRTRDLRLRSLWRESTTGGVMEVTRERE
ncbi:hypothetical protein ZHAS_00004064 [Anopheles sinensis]|uniref:Uncharacterized protein n=1 Tax=Anopheles sinensis TaxID=74873 RepID=A0A084VG01_ANOSI|nr:hypothetical protein ZHAS_00004064 [Anopheles sinensis]